MKFDYDDDLLHSNNSVTSVDKSDFNSSTKGDYQQQNIDNILSDINSDKKNNTNNIDYDSYSDFNTDKDNNISNYPDNNSSEFKSEIDNHYDDYGKTDLDKLILNQNNNLAENDTDIDQQSMNSLYYNSADEDLQQDKVTLMQAEQDRIDHTDDNSDERHGFWHDMFSSDSTIADDSDNKSDEDDDEPYYQDPYYQDPTYTSQYDDNDK